MSPLVESSLFLARQHVRVFQCRHNSKLPAVDKFSERATSNSDDIIKMFASGEFNSGIATGWVADGIFLSGVDIDYKDGRDGFQTIDELAKAGFVFPDTYCQRSPSGGEHKLYWSSVPIKQGANVDGLIGLDLRGAGGYILCSGSSIDGKFYTTKQRQSIMMAPDWYVKRFKKKEKIISIGQNVGITPVDNQVMALKDSVEFLQKLTPAHKGSRNDELFLAVCKLKDFGLSADQIPEVIITYWKCEPMLELHEINHVVNSSFKYGKSSPGVAAPERAFEKIIPTPETDPGPPELIFNRDHFYVAANGISRVYQETKRHGQFHLEAYSVHIFHEKYCADTMQVGSGRLVAKSELWMKSPKRRNFDEVMFSPGGDKPKIYNTWKGFAVKPDSDPTSNPGQKYAEMFIQHCHENICGGDKKLTDWLIGFFSHLFQKPGEKPQVSLVFKGLKGTGKTIVSKILGHLIGKHAIILSSKDHLTNHFNSILEEQLLITLDEAFWSGDKSLEGKLKAMITDDVRTIEHKGAKPYPTPVYDRIIIIGNDSHLVLATGDERRFAVFNVGDGKIQNQDFFGEMKDGITKYGGDTALMRYFMDYDLKGFNPNVAPKTIGLKEQKEHSMNHFERWWKDCLEDGLILGSGFDHWPESIKIRDLHQAFADQMGKEKIKTYLNSSVTKGLFKHMSPSTQSKPIRYGSDVAKSYCLASLATARKEWDKCMNVQTDWGELDELL
jgi:hypothetical protein